MPLETPPACEPGRWPRAGASAIVLRGDAVLLVQRGKGSPTGLWSPPGGHIEPGETSIAAAAREVMEETGIEARLHGLVDVHDVIVRDGAGGLAAHYLLAVHFGTYLSGEPQAGSDASAARFFPLAELATLPLTAEARGLIVRAVELLRSRQDAT